MQPASAWLAMIASTLQGKPSSRFSWGAAIVPLMGQSRGSRAAGVPGLAWALEQNTGTPIGAPSACLLKRLSSQEVYCTPHDFEVLLFVAALFPSALVWALGERLVLQTQPSSFSSHQYATALIWH